MFIVIQIKKAAVNILRDYTGSEDGLRTLGKYAGVAVPSLSLLLAENKVIISYTFVDNGESGLFHRAV